MQVINKPSSTVDKYCAVIKVICDRFERLLYRPAPLMSLLQNCYGYGRAPLPSPSVASGPREVFPRTGPYLPLYTSKVPTGFGS